MNKAGSNQVILSPVSASSNKSFKNSDLQQFENLKIINREQSKTISDIK